MTGLTTPEVQGEKVNAVGLTRKDYMGGKSTLCVGCGHDSITTHIISAYFQSGVNPYDVAKLSGIGCSSKTPAYFLSMSHGFNSIHGRMAPVAAGVKLVNPKLNLVGVSGDGDTGSIGIGGFSHLIRRNIPMVYIIENNGVYGLTKGQFSATADLDSKAKSGVSNAFSTIDLCGLAIELGCGFVARSFSGDAKQLVPLLAAAIRYPGTAIIDIVSPCITFANHEGSTKSYPYVKDHKINLQELGFVQPREEISVDYKEGDHKAIELPDGSQLMLKKLHSSEHNLEDSIGALKLLHEHRDRGQILTGLFVLKPVLKDYKQVFNLSDKPAVHMTDADLIPEAKTLAAINKAFK
jgi:2-oxoglutarate ferredoxin oxidoreductase subunit beta